MEVRVLSSAQASKHPGRAGSCRKSQSELGPQGEMAVALAASFQQRQGAELRPEVLPARPRLDGEAAPDPVPHERVDDIYPVVALGQLALINKGAPGMRGGPFGQVKQVCLGTVDRP